MLSSNSTQSLRQQGRAARKKLSLAQRRIGTARLNRKLCYQLRHSKRIAVYLGFDGEPELGPAILSLLAAGKQLYLPQLTKQGMRFVSIHALNQARLNQYGIIEPSKSATTISSKRLQAIVLPLTAYDKTGQRLGMGAGYYDRKLTWTRQRKHWRGPLLIGSAWQVQEAEKITRENWDISLHRLVNETETLRF